MTSPQRRRVAAALACRPADRVPLGELHVEDGLVAALAGARKGEPIPFATRRSVLERLHLDAVAAYPELPGGDPMLGVHLAGPGTGGRGGAGAAVDLGLPDPAELDWRPVRRWREDSPFFVLAVLPGPFGELSYLRGMEAFLVLAWRRPDEAQRLAERMVDYALELAALAREQGAQGFVIGEDVAWDGGLLLRESLYRERFLPALRREVAGLRALGGPVVFHSDGDVTALLGDLEEAGVDGLHGLSAASGLDLGRLADRLGARLSRWGNLDLDALELPSPEGIAGRVGDTLAAGRASPGYVFGTSAGILDASLPPAAVQAAYDRAYELAGAPAPVASD